MPCTPADTPLSHSGRPQPPLAPCGAVRGGEAPAPARSSCPQSPALRRGESWPDNGLVVVWGVPLWPHSAQLEDYSSCVSQPVVRGQPWG